MKESAFTNEVIDGLTWIGIKAYRANSGKIIIPGSGTTRRRCIQLLPKGFSDVLCILPVTARWMVVETKMKKNQPEPEQAEFMQFVRDMGGIAFPAWSLNDVWRGLAANLRPEEARALRTPLSELCRDCEALV